MPTELSAVVSPEDLRKNFEHLQTDLTVIQNEFDQAISVWRSLLSSEKQETKKLLEDREKAWDKDDIQWQNDRKAYEQKIEELEAFFQTQLSLTDKNAVRALNELDAAWQQERIRWQQSQAQQSKEAYQREELQAISQQQLERRLTQLEEVNRQLQARLTESQAAPAGTQTLSGDQERQYQSRIASLETQAADWQAERTAWQEAEQAWTVERQEKEALVQTLQQQLESVEGQHHEPPPVQKTAQPPVEIYLNALETQITSLQEYVQQMLPASYSLRRRTDRTTLPSSDLSAGQASDYRLPPRASN